MSSLLMITSIYVTVNGKLTGTYCYSQPLEVHLVQEPPVYRSVMFRTALDCVRDAEYARSYEYAFGRYGPTACVEYPSSCSLRRGLLTESTRCSMTIVPARPEREHSSLTATTPDVEFAGPVAIVEF